jgi:hypothetical protein
MLKSPEIYKTDPNIQGTQYIDIYDSALTELYFLRNPDKPKKEPDFKVIKEFLISLSIKPIYVHFPWKNTVVRMPSEEIYTELLTARNKNLITADEQDKFRSLKIGIAGLSVGSSAFLTLAAMSGPKFMKIADLDTLELTNLNRIRADIFDVGKPKVEIAAKSAWEINPFLSLEIWDEGVASSDLEKFITNPKLDVFIDEMDNLELKLKARLICKDSKIPVIMATDTDDGTLIDIERYDTEENIMPFNGRIGDIKLENLAGIDKKTWVGLAMKIIGPEFMSEKLRNSMAEIGKTLGGPPQLFSAASVSGAMVAYAVRCIAIGEKISSGKFIMTPDKSLNLELK